MKRLIVPICILLLSTAALSQMRSRSTRRQSTAKTPPSATTTSDATAKTDGANRIAIQIKNLSVFLYRYGRISKDLEALNAANQSSPTNDRNKAQVKASFEDFRVGLDQLEIYFRSTAGLQGYYVKLAGSAAGAAAAEEQAAAGNYDQAGKDLLGVVGRLADVLALMH